jgi:hypothetical protein
MPKRKTKETQVEQSKAFIEKAREIGADADKDDDEVMRRLAKQQRRGEGATEPRSGKRKTAS